MPRTREFIIVADAHRAGARLIVHAECLATAMLELKVQAQRTIAENAQN